MAPTKCVNNYVPLTPTPQTNFIPYASASGTSQTISQLESPLSTSAGSPSEPTITPSQSIQSQQKSPESQSEPGSPTSLSPTLLSDSSTIGAHKKKKRMPSPNNSQKTQKPSEHKTHSTSKGKKTASDKTTASKSNYLKNSAQKNSIEIKKKTSKDSQKHNLANDTKNKTADSKSHKKVKIDPKIEETSKTEPKGAKNGKNKSSAKKSTTKQQNKKSKKKSSKSSKNNKSQNNIQSESYSVLTYELNHNTNQHQFIPLQCNSSIKQTINSNNNKHNFDKPSSRHVKFSRISKSDHHSGNENNNKGKEKIKDESKKLDKKLEKSKKEKKQPKIPDENNKKQPRTVHFNEEKINQTKKISEKNPKNYINYGEGMSPLSGALPLSAEHHASDKSINSNRIISSSYQQIKSVDDLYKTSNNTADSAVYPYSNPIDISLGNRPMTTQFDDSSYNFSLEQCNPDFGELSQANLTYSYYDDSTKLENDKFIDRKQIRFLDENPDLLQPYHIASRRLSQPVNNLSNLSNSYTSASMQLPGASLVTTDKKIQLQPSWTSESIDNPVKSYLLDRFNNCNRQSKFGKRNSSPRSTISSSSSCSCCPVTDAASCCNIVKPLKSSEFSPNTTFNPDISCNPNNNYNPVNIINIVPSEILKSLERFQTVGMSLSSLPSNENKYVSNNERATYNSQEAQNSLDNNKSTPEFTYSPADKTAITHGVVDDLTSKSSSSTAKDAYQITPKTQKSSSVMFQNLNQVNSEMLNQTEETKLKSGRPTSPTNLSQADSAILKQSADTTFIDGRPISPTNLNRPNLGILNDTAKSKLKTEGSISSKNSKVNSDSKPKVKFAKSSSDGEQLSGSERRKRSRQVKKQRAVKKRKLIAKQKLNIKPQANDSNQSNSKYRMDQNSKRNNNDFDINYSTNHLDCNQSSNAIENITVCLRSISTNDSLCVNKPAGFMSTANENIKYKNCIAEYEVVREKQAKQHQLNKSNTSHNARQIKIINKHEAGNDPIAFDYHEVNKRANELCSQKYCTKPSFKAKSKHLIPSESKSFYNFFSLRNDELQTIKEKNNNEELGDKRVNGSLKKNRNKNFQLKYAENSINGMVNETESCEQDYSYIYKQIRVTNESEKNKKGNKNTRLNKSFPYPSNIASCSKKQNKHKNYEQLIECAKNDIIRTISCVTLPDEMKQIASQLAVNSVDTITATISNIFNCDVEQFKIVTDNIKRASNMPHINTKVKHHNLKMHDASCMISGRFLTVSSSLLTAGSICKNDLLQLSMEQVYDIVRFNLFAVTQANTSMTTVRKKAIRLCNSFRHLINQNSKINTNKHLSKTLNYKTAMVSYGVQCIDAMLANAVLITRRQLLELIATITKEIFMQVKNFPIHHFSENSVNIATKIKYDIIKSIVIEIIKILGQDGNSELVDNRFVNIANVTFNHPSSAYVALHTLHTADFLLDEIARSVDASYLIKRFHYTSATSLINDTRQALQNGREIKVQTEITLSVRQLTIAEATTTVANQIIDITFVENASHAQNIGLDIEIMNALHVFGQNVFKV